ncbi:hypothetical protein ACMYSK_06875 [Klebsiella sp. I138]|uniref:hypothetical protein n=1 Tax=Klebsiella sp. I138 TaxID=2755385 RepID=UPI003DA9D9A1
MSKYVIFISASGGKAFPKEQVTRAFINAMKDKGFRKHHIEVDAENETQAVMALNQFNDEYMQEVKDYTGNIIFVGVIMLFGFIIWLFA